MATRTEARERAWERVIESAERCFRAGDSR